MGAADPGAPLPRRPPGLVEAGRRRRPERLTRGLIQGAGELLLGHLPAGSYSAGQRASLRATEHRPWPLPEMPWFMGQSWVDLLFAHWRVDPEELQPVVPGQLPVETFDGSAWIGVTPFLVCGLRLRGTPPVPVLSSFPEINVRTYVSVDGKPGIYFFSLDADSRLAVWAARRAYRLPYFRSDIRLRHDGGAFRYRVRRISEDGPPAEFEAAYGPAGRADPAEPGSLAHWLTERYCLYTLDDRQRILRAEIHHPPWPLQSAWIEPTRNSMARAFGIELAGEPLLHFSARQDVVLWRLGRASS